MNAMIDTRHGDMLDVLAAMDSESVDSVVTDPPYGLEFMGRAWDHGVPGPDYWQACLRVMRPGGHLLAFGGTRTAHRLTCAIEDAGFEIRDQLTWLYGSGFPKSLDVSKAIDKAAGAEREVVGPISNRGIIGSRNGVSTNHGRGGSDAHPNIRAATAPATDAARQWQGWGTALKPASEPIIVARKPLAGTVAANVLAHGTGALNIDATRVGTTVETWPSSRGPNTRNSMSGGVMAQRDTGEVPSGRWPANVVFAHAPGCGPDEAPGQCVLGCPVAELDAQSGISKSQGGAALGNFKFAKEHHLEKRDPGFGDVGGASRFFPTFRYQAKAPSRERPKVDGVAHPTVKPLALMRWLVRLVTPRGGVVLDPFAGSGTTGEAAALEGMRAVLVEREEVYLPLIAARLERVPA